MKSTMGVLMSGVLGILAGATVSYAQTTVPDRSPTVDPDTGRTVQRDATGDRVVVKERVVERRHEGEAYVAGFVGYTLGHSFANVDGTGGLSTTGIESLDLANSVAYGMKVGYFLPTRKLNWLGFELEAFNTTPHLEAQNGFAIGSNLNVATVAINVIARKRLACDDRDRHDRTRRVTTHDKDGTTVQDKDGRHDDYDKDGRHYDDDWSPEAENARCPLQVYAGAGPAIFFAQTSGIGASGGITGNYKASHFVGGLAVHF